jgi:two-component system, OmpR family, response regulator
MMQNARIMLVEDDENLGFLIKDYLSSHGCKVNVYADGEKGLSAFHSRPFDLCILDIMLPAKDGFDLAMEIRKYNQKIPIVFLTAKSQTEDRIKGFQAGADDYVCKPFSIEEFKYRIEAVLKRAGLQSGAGSDQSELRAGDSTLDLANLLLNARGTVTQLTYKEARMLELFFRHPNKLIGRDVFLKTIWEDDGFFVARSMDVFVSRIRKYLKGDESLRIENVRGVGYVMKERSPMQGDFKREA